MGDPFGMYVARGMRGVGSGHPRYLQMRAGRGGYRHVCVRTYTIFFHVFVLWCLTLPSLKKGVFVRNGYSSPMRSVSVVMKKAFFT